jgi:hypothetical protein
MGFAKLNWILQKCIIMVVEEDRHKKDEHHSEDGVENILVLSDHDNIVFLI